MLTAIQKITRQASRIANGNAKIKPGQPERLSEAASIGDGAWQGDLGLEVVESAPRDYLKVSMPSEAHRQLAPGTTQGARHCLDSLDGVTLYHPPGFGADYEGLSGPCFVLSKERVVVHPTHGNVTIPAGFTIRCRYQREYDAELRRERRNAD